MVKEVGAVASKDDLPPQIGKYVVVGRLGRGAMGQVFRANDPVLNRPVAIKTMVADLSADQELRQRFLREAQSAAGLNHPNLVTLHDFGEDQGQFYMAMELLDGHDLSLLIKQQRLVSFEDKLALMDQVCDGLAYAHSMQVVHRDLKPANIHVQTSGRVKIMDFGLARGAGSEMTRAGTVMGTPNYMSPEQVRGERADARSDVFSLGAVFYEVLAGRRACDAEAMLAVMYKVTTAEPDPLALVCPEVPSIVSELVEKALRKDPAQRFADAQQMRVALEVCHQVLEGLLDEQEGLDSLRESRTLIQAPPLTDAPTVHTYNPSASTSPPIARRGSSGSLPVVRVGQPGQPPVGHVTKRPGSGSAAASRTRARPPSAPSVAAQPIAASRSKAPLYLAAAALVAAALAAVVFLVTRERSTPEKPQAESEAGALVAVAVESQLEVARKNLEYKDLQGAIAAADKALRLDPESAEARSIQERARAALAAVEADVNEAREAARVGDTDKATKALARVLAQAPDHPVAKELSAQLDSRFRGRSEEALTEMRSAAQAAERAGASSLREYADASRFAREASELLSGRHYTEATQWALGAKKAYERARTAALELAAQAKAAAAARQSAAPIVTVPVTTPAATQPPALPSLAPAPTPPPATVPVVPAGPSPEELVRGLIADFGRAIESKDIALYRTLRPGLSNDEERRLRAAYDGVKSQEVELAIQSISIEGAKAQVRVVRKGRVNGQLVPASQQTFRLARRGAGWVIEDIGQ